VTTTSVQIRKLIHVEQLAANGDQAALLVQLAADFALLRCWLALLGELIGCGDLRVDIFAR
jgi:hypothetical protein